VTAISNVEFPHQLPHKRAASQQHTAAAAGAAAAAGGQWQQEDQVAQEYPVCVAVQQTATGGTGSSSGSSTQRLVRCSYLVAADGAHSVIRWGLTKQQRQQQWMLLQTMRAVVLDAVLPAVYCHCRSPSLLVAVVLAGPC
jgi:2-polyprenyl-6-methoxyphenol hydroxylase-like FAD-dependent oxidoreductase